MQVTKWTLEIHEQCVSGSLLKLQPANEVISKSFVIKYYVISLVPEVSVNCTLTLSYNQSSGRLLSIFSTWTSVLVSHMTNILTSYLHNYFHQYGEVNRVVSFRKLNNNSDMHE